MAALTNRDTNVQMAAAQPEMNEKQQKSVGEENKGQRTLQQQIADQNNKQSGNYISPSDAILSPASQKLAGFKQRQINKQQNGRAPTARSLFSRTASSVSSASLDDAEDVSSK
ncbi:hypothetical protein PRZ48_007093 [Zasmidium cellare]|uniref:Uncharacterized protein n=1 Tax=Zasmidium cellare TaxID=395010 RepID=A0ABR0EIE5_ZASCE|nr:hypothetical protein PRZ48_007093 [Zasmidium cellare]